MPKTYARKSGSSKRTSRTVKSTRSWSKGRKTTSSSRKSTTSTRKVKTKVRKYGKATKARKVGFFGRAAKSTTARRKAA